MKRNISINISGIIFHVEEDGYDSLKNYLESITRYFSHYEDSKEIVDDIESRIAEIFLTKLSSSKQVITQYDVEAVIATMGNVEDFAAEEMLEEDTYQYQQQRTSHTADPDPESRRKLFRDTRRKVLGGVAAGIAYYFRTDPLWVRIFILLALFADVFITVGALSTITIIAYVVCWIVVPGRENLVPDEKLKKLFRDPDDKVLGGVCGGIAAYFGVDATIVRLVFVVAIFFGGVSIIVYPILWIITPLAVTLTDKMQMKGEPVTLSNIESSIKKNFRVSEEGEESTMLKAVLFPFRLLGAIFSNLGRAIGPLLIFLGEAARVLGGLLLAFIGGTLLIALISVAGVLLGATNSYNFAVNDIQVNIPWEVLENSVPTAGIIFLLIVLIVPALLIALSGISIAIKRWVISAPVGWSALGVWFVALIGASVTLLPIANDFQTEARYTATETLPVTGKTAILTLSEQPEYEEPLPQLTLQGYEDSVYTLRKTFEARGGNRQRALAHAQKINYPVTVRDSTIVFPPVFSFQEGAPYRKQELDMTLYVPYGQPFMIDRNLATILRKSTLYRNDLSARDLQDNTFMFTRTGLACITCGQRINMDDAFSDDARLMGEKTNLADLRDFTALKVTGPFVLEVLPSDTFAVSLQGDESQQRNVRAKVVGETLSLSYQDTPDRNEALKVTIAAPAIEKVMLGGTVRADLRALKATNLVLDLSGASQAEAEGGTAEIQVIMSGTSHLQLSGQSQLLKANLSGASQLEGLGLEAQKGLLELSGAAEAKVNARETLSTTINGAASVVYQGNPAVDVNRSGKDKIRRAAD